ncbi:MAG: hypothetical protein ACREJC_00720, partial [Tepidisphaeraceae bacterium]
MMRHRLLIGAVSAALPALWLAADAKGYGYYRYGNGRADFNSRYDLAGNSYPGQGNANIYAFGQIDGFTGAQLTSMGLTAAQVNTSVGSASDAWEQYLNISITNTTAANGTGNLLRFVSVAGNGASTLGYQHTGNNWTELRFGVNGPSAGVPWNPTNFAWTLKHELGHALGLRDMYPDFAGAPYAEDFVDHPVPGNPNPFHNGNLAANDGRRDNLMDRYRTTSNDYTLAPQTDIDNDEIAGGAWVWGSPYNQIVTGDLQAQWTSTSGAGNVVRITEEHHGDQPTNAGGLGWWDYRGNIKSGGEDKPHIDLDFNGYDNYTYFLYDDDGNVPSVTHIALGGTIHRFEIDEAGWGGNFELFVHSTISEEGRISAAILGGARMDTFNMAPSDTGLDFAGGNTWAQVFGPIPEPGSFALMSMG